MTLFDIPVVCEFLDIFPDELPSLPTDELPMSMKLFPQHSCVIVKVRKI
jgi:hypothetical protein